jgi:hypothetical protein
LQDQQQNDTADNYDTIKTASVHYRDFTKLIITITKFYR